MSRLEAAIDSMDVFDSCHPSKSVTYVAYRFFRPPAKIHGQKKLLSTSCHSSSLYNLF